MRKALLGFGLFAKMALVAGCNAAPGDVPDAAVPADLATAAPDLAPSPSAACAQMQLTPRAWNAGPYGALRDDVVDDFTITDQNGPWHFRDQYSGCDSYVFIPDSVPVSANDQTSIWNADLDGLLAKSPPNVHYFFISRQDDAQVPAQLDLINQQLAQALATLPPGSAPGQQDWWKPRIHLVQGSGKSVPGWIGQLMHDSATTSPVGPYGFAIDRAQRLRGVGNYADVERYDPGLAAAMQWPWQNNLAYAANPPLYFNYEAQRDDKLAAEKSPTIVTAWNHDMLNLTVEKDVALPAADQMRTFDRLEIDLLMNCPQKDKAEENNNCGAWDYIVELDLLDMDGKTWIEVARFISSYHRAGRWLVDATHALPFLAAGGTRHFRFIVSPQWNPQTYDTVMNLRFIDSGGALKPVQSVYLFPGGGFNSGYDMNRTPVMVPIPAAAKKVELRAIITGHGADTKATCAEFCNDTHQFTVSGMGGQMVYSKNYPEASTPEGCMDQINRGVVPNQSGTWWLGRQGWCPGAQVDPWIVDVTAQATAGQTASVAYQGLVNGKPPMVSLGNIDMNSWLVIWQ